MCPIWTESQSPISLYHAPGFRLRTTLGSDLRANDIHPVDQRRLITNWVAFSIRIYVHLEVQLLPYVLTFIRA